MNLQETLSKLFSGERSTPQKRDRDRDILDKAQEFILGPYLGHPVETARRIAKGDEEAVKGLAEDIAWIAGPYAIGKLAAPILRPISRAWRPIGTAIWEKAFLEPWKKVELTKVGKVLTPAKTIVEHHAPEATKLLETYERGVGTGRRLGLEVAEKVKQLPLKEQLRLLSALRGRIPIEELDEPAREIAGKLLSYGEKTEIPKLASTVIREKLKVLTPRIAPVSERGQKRVIKAIDDIGQAILQKPISDLKGDELYKALRTIAEHPHTPEPYRKLARKLYETHQAFYNLSAKTVRETEEAILFNKIAQNPKFVSDVPKPGFRKPRNPVWVRSKNLSKLYVAEPIANAIDDIHNAKRYVKGTFGEIIDKIDEYFMVPWKTGKVILSPPTHFRNIMTNMMLNDIGGLPFHRVDFYARALREMLRNSEKFQEFSKLTGLGFSFAKAEVGEAVSKVFSRVPKNRWDVLLQKYYKFAKPFMHAYGAEETWAKFAKFLWNLEKGKMRPEEAAKDALKWTLDYRQVSPAVRVLRSTAWPFATFTFKVAPVILEASVKNPARVAKWVILPWWIQQVALHRLRDLTEAEWEQIKENMPEYIRQGYMVLLPWRDAKGRLQLLDFTYVLPLWSDITEGTTNPFRFAGQNPLLSIYSALRHNQTFTGAPIWLETDPPITKLQKVLQYVWQELAPGILPGGSTFRHLTEPIAGGPRAKTPGQALAYFFGAKTVPVDLPRWATAKRIKVSEAERQIRAQMRKDLLNAKTRADVQRIYKQTAERLEKLRKMREAKPSARFSMDFVLRKILENEGGLKPVRLGDKAGLTIGGITQRWHPKEVKELAKLLAKGDRKGAESVVLSVYREHYLKPILRTGVRNLAIIGFLTDAAVNMNPSRAKALLRRATGASSTKEAAKIANESPEAVLKNLLEERLRYYRSLPDYKRFGRGWENRSKKAYKDFSSLLSSYFPSSPQSETRR